MSLSQVRRLNVAVAICRYFPVRRCRLIIVYTLILKSSLQFFLNLKKYTYSKGPCKRPTVLLWLVAYVCMEPHQCWHMLALVGTRCVQFETGQTFGPISPNISIVLRPAKRSATMLRSFAWIPSNVGLVKTPAYAPCNIVFKKQTIIARFLLSGLL